MITLKGKRILIFQQRQWGLSIGHPLAKRLQSMGATLGAYCIKNSTLRFVREQTEIRYAEVFSADEALAQPEEFLDGERISLEDLCRELGVDTVWPLVQAVRNYVKSYPDRFGFGFRQNIPDARIVMGITSLFKSVREVFERFRPDLIFAPNYVSLPHIMFNLYGKRHGVPMLALSDAKIGRFLVASGGYLDDSGPFFDRYAALLAGAPSANTDLAREYIGQLRNQLASPRPISASALENGLRPWWLLGKRIAMLLVHKVLRKARSVLVPSDAPTVRLLVRDFLAQRRNQRHCEMFPYEDFEDIGPFVYFPLQVQPEMQLDVVAPRYNNQLETARQIAMSLPGDLTLVVKDHPSMAREGLRPRSYLEKLARTPNIKLIDYRIPTPVVLRRARMVISPACTTFSEAALMRVPCLQLGPMGSTELLPNVSRAEPWDTLARQILRVLTSRLDTPEYEQALERFATAAFDVGTLLDHDHIWYHGTEEEVDAFCGYCINSILHSLGEPEPSRQGD